MIRFMCSRKARSALHWRVAPFPQATCSPGGLRMNFLVWSMLVLFLCSSTKGMVVDKTRLSRRRSYQLDKGQHIIQDFKRHSDGTFTSDFAKNLDKMKAKHFVEWLACTRGQGCREDLLRMAAEV